MSLELDLTDIIDLNLRLLNNFGYFRSIPPKNPTEKVPFWLSKCLFVFFFLAISLLSETADMIASTSNLQNLSNASFLFLTHLVTASKLYVFLTKTDQVWHLIGQIQSPEFQPGTVEQYQSLKTGVAASRTITKIFLGMGVVTCCLWGIFPFFQASGGRVQLPLSGWYPFDSSKSPVFELVYLYRCLGALANGFGNITMDTFLAGVLMVVSGQLHSLKLALEAADCTRNNQLKHVRHYQKIIELARNIVALFTNCLALQFFISVLIICMTFFKMSLISVLSLEFLSMVLYQACMVLEIFLWCYYGNETIIYSKQIVTAIYMSNWLEGPKEFKSGMIFFMTRAQVPVTLYAGGYFPLSLDTFKTITKSSWSYFLFLHNFTVASVPI